MPRYLAVTFQSYMTAKSLTVFIPSFNVVTHFASQLLVYSAPLCEKVLKKGLNEQYNNPSIPGTRQHCEHSLWNIIVNLNEKVYIKHDGMYTSNDAS